MGYGVYLGGSSDECNRVGCGAVCGRRRRRGLLMHVGICPVRLALLCVGICVARLHAHAHRGVGRIRCGIRSHALGGISVLLGGIFGLRNGGMLRAMRVLLAGRLGFDVGRRVRVGCSSVNPLILGGIGRRVRLFFAGDVRCGRGLLLIAFVRLAIVFEVLAIEGVFAVIYGVVYLRLRERRAKGGLAAGLRLIGIAPPVFARRKSAGHDHHRHWREGVCGLRLLDWRDLHRLRLGRALLRIGGVAVRGRLGDGRGVSRPPMP